MSAFEESDPFNSGEPTPAEMPELAWRQIMASGMIQVTLAAAEAYGLEPIQDVEADPLPYHPGVNNLPNGMPALNMTITTQEESEMVWSIVGNQPVPGPEMAYLQWPGRVNSLVYFETSLFDSPDQRLEYGKRILGNQWQDELADHYLTSDGMSYVLAHIIVGKAVVCTYDYYKATKRDFLPTLPGSRKDIGSKLFLELQRKHARQVERDVHGLFCTDKHSS